MAVESFWFGKAVLNAFGGGSAALSPNVDFLSDTIRCALFTSDHAPDQDDEFYDGDHGMIEAASDEGTTYTTGGQTLTSKTLTYAAGVTTWDAANLAWASPSNITAQYACIYDATPGTNKPFLWWIDFGASDACTATFAITFAETGIATAT